MAEDTHYKVLGVKPDATNDEIRSAYRRLIFRVVGPDQADNDPLYRRVEEAYRTLSNAERRYDYDQRLKRGPPRTDYPARTDQAQAQEQSESGEAPFEATTATKASFFRRKPWAGVVVAGFLEITLFGFHLQYPSLG